MFCYQCEQTTRTEAGAGCNTAKGVCGKDEATADLQDLLIYQVKGIGQYSKKLHELGKPDAAADHFIRYAMFHADERELQPATVRGTDRRGGGDS